MVPRDDAEMERSDAVEEDGKTEEEVVDEKYHMAPEYNEVEEVLVPLAVLGMVGKGLDMDGVVSVEVDEVEVAVGAWTTRCVDVDIHGDGAAQMVWKVLL